MAEPQLTELRPVDHITTDAIGPPGQRVFYVQATKGDQTVTLIVEKHQIETLPAGVEQFHKDNDHSSTSLNHSWDCYRMNR